MLENEKHDLVLARLSKRIMNIGEIDGLRFQFDREPTRIEENRLIDNNEIKIDRYSFDLIVRDQIGRKVAILYISYFLKPMRVFKLNLIRVEPAFKGTGQDTDNKYGSRIMSIFQSLIGDGIGVLNDRTQGIWYELDNEAGVEFLEQKYLANFYEKRGWKKIFPNEVADNNSTAKYFSVKDLSTEVLERLRLYWQNYVF